MSSLWHDDSQLKQKTDSFLVYFNFDHINNKQVTESTYIIWGTYKTHILHVAMTTGQFFTGTWTQDKIKSYEKYKNSKG